MCVPKFVCVCAKMCVCVCQNVCLRVHVLMCPYVCNCMYIRCVYFFYIYIFFNIFACAKNVMSLFLSGICMYTRCVYFFYIFFFIFLHAQKYAYRIWYIYALYMQISDKNKDMTFLQVHGCRGGCIESAYGVASVSSSRIDKIVGLFCKRAL